MARREEVIHRKTYRMVSPKHVAPNKRGFRSSISACIYYSL